MNGETNRKNSLMNKPKTYTEEDVKESIKTAKNRLKDEVENIQKDFANLDICDKEEVIKLIDKVFLEEFGGELIIDEIKEHLEDKKNKVKEDSI